MVGMRCECPMVRRYVCRGIRCLSSAHGSHVSKSEVYPFQRTRNVRLETSRKFPLCCRMLCTSNSSLSSSPILSASWVVPMNGVTLSEWNMWTLSLATCWQVILFLIWFRTVYGPRSFGVSLDERNECMCSFGFHNIWSPIWYVFCECFFLLRVLVVRVLVQIDSRCDAHVVFIAAIR